jgi:hypothetical protein
MEISLLLLLLWSVLAFWVLGQIWYAQIVIYPMFAQVGATEYSSYHAFYARHIPLPVIVPGFASFLLPIALALFGPAVPAWMTAANIATGIASLLVTVILEIPRHTRLEKLGKDDVVIRELVAFNWPRTLAITGQSAITFMMLAHVFGRA